MQNARKQPANTNVLAKTISWRHFIEIQAVHEAA